MICGDWLAQGVYVAARLELADLLAAGPLTAAELAGRCGADASALFRLLRMLASVGVFAEQDDGRFGLTPMAELLQRQRPGSAWALAMMMGEEHHAAWGQLLYSVQTGKPAFDHVHGKPVFRYLAENPRAAAIFDGAMTGIHGQETAAMLDAYDFAGVGTLMDVGGGNGSLLRATLGRHATLQGILYDLPHVVERARPGLADLGGRLQTIGGDFFQSVPTGADAILMRHIIHDWSDDESLAILRNCRAALPPSGKLLLVECVIPPGNVHSWGKQLDVNMLVMTTGKERTEEEYRRLYTAAGFRLNRIVPTATEMSVIEGVPA
jgi:hypothetical protein